MEWNKNNLIKIIEFINCELKNGKPMVRIERELFGENERVIHKRLTRLGYKKINNQYTLKGDITKNITKNISGNSLKKESENKKNLLKQEDVISDINIDKEKLKLLLENLDDLLRLITINEENNTGNIIDIRSGITDVKSFRIDTGIYEEVKKIAYESKENIGEIINKALIRYLVK